MQDDLDDDDTVGRGVLGRFQSSLVDLLLPDNRESAERDERFLRHHKNIYLYEEFLFSLIYDVVKHSPECLYEKMLLQDLDDSLKNKPLDPTLFFDIFEKAWPSEEGQAVCKSFSPRPRVHSSWFSIRGEMGESLLSWTWLLKIRYVQFPEITQLLQGLMEAMLDKSPDLAAVQYDSEPRIGQTILHQACSEGNAPLVDKILKTGRADKNKRMKGAFNAELMRLPKDYRVMEHIVTPTDLLSHEIDHSSSPLEVAMLAPAHDDDAVDVVRMLLSADADPIMWADVQPETKVDGHDQSKGRKVLFTLLHVLARSRWQGPGPFHASETRTSRVLALLVDKQSLVHHKLPSDMQNCRGFTPLQAAAAFGNEVFFVEMLNWLKVYVQKWGSVYAYGFPLVELDSGASETDFAALEVMALWKRAPLLNLGICETILRHKWQKFGWPALRMMLFIEITAVICTAVVILDDSEGYDWFRWWARAIGLSVAVPSVASCILLYLVCANDEKWFRYMPMIATGDKRERTSVYDLLTFSFFKSMLSMTIMILTVPWYHQAWFEGRPLYATLWHGVVAVWWFDYILHTLRFFELNERTGALAAAIPTIFVRDMIPFCTIYSIIFLCSSIALRVSTSLDRSAKSKGDMTIGTWWRTIMTLEEAIHGPDVTWRPLVQNHPAMAAAAFIVFLWLTLMMMTILVSMFSSRYDTLVKHNHEHFLYRRATFIITIEKMVPLWYHKRARLATGRPLGKLVDHHNKAVKRRPSTSSDITKQMMVSENTPLVNTENRDRWIVLKGTDATFKQWREPHTDFERKHSEFGMNSDSHV